MPAIDWFPKLAENDRCRPICAVHDVLGVRNNSLPINFQEDGLKISVQSPGLAVNTNFGIGGNTVSGW